MNLNLEFNLIMIWNIPRIDFISLMNQIKKEGFISTMRGGPTGIGYTLESLLGINENNHNLHDYIDDGKFKDHLFELKANRSIIRFIPGKTKKNKSMLSLVTQAPHEGLSNRKLIGKYGYPATDGRDTVNLYTTLVCTRYTNGKNIKNMKIERQNGLLYIIHKNEKLSHYNLIKIFKKITSLAIVRTEVEYRLCKCGNTKLHDRKTKNYHNLVKKLKKPVNVIIENLEE